MEKRKIYITLFIFISVNSAWSNDRGFLIKVAYGLSETFYSDNLQTEIDDFALGNSTDIVYHFHFDYGFPINKNSYITLVFSATSDRREYFLDGDYDADDDIMITSGILGVGFLNYPNSKFFYWNGALGLAGFDLKIGDKSTPHTQPGIGGNFGFGIDSIGNKNGTSIGVGVKYSYELYMDYQMSSLSFYLSLFYKSKPHST